MNTSSLSDRDNKVIWHPYTQHKTFGGAIPITTGKGAVLYDESGNAYIDAISSWWVTIHGHAHPYLAEKVYQQALLLEQVIFTHFTHEPAILLAERLLRILPGGLSKIFFSDNGSTAVEVAIKMALQYWKNKGKENRTKIVAFKHAYHGDTFGAMSVSSRGLFTDAFRDLLFDVIFIDTPDDSNLEANRSVLQSHMGEIAAFIYEPLLQAAGGMRMYSANHMNLLLEMVKQQEILCIADEVLTGFGRTGNLFASESLHQSPDLICLSKGLTGGMMALGITACKQKIFDAFLSDDSSRTFFHGHSYTANPLACSAGLASLDLLEDQKCRNQINAIREQHEKFLKNKLQDNKQNLFRNMRILGTILAFEINAGKDEYINQAGAAIMQKALSQGIYLRPLGNTVYVMPPYCITPAQLEKIYEFLLSLKESMGV